MNAQKLHRVGRKVRPGPAHPTYYDWQFGFLTLYLYAESIVGARERANAIIESLPYETVGEEALVETDFPHTQQALNRDSNAVRNAMGVGLSIRLFCCPTGTDESSFESTPLSDWF